MSGDPLVFGPFPKPVGFGATVFNFQTSVQWNSQSYNATFDIVEDPIQNDEYIYKNTGDNYPDGKFIGSPTSFTYGNFTFCGLVKSSDQMNSPGQGNPVYRLVLTSPSEVLHACQCVLCQYVGSCNDSLFNGGVKNNQTFQVSNLLNLYGYAEGGGNNFGRSNVTSIGMPWKNKGFGISEAIQTLTSTDPKTANQNPQTNFGSYLIYKGNYYSVDLSNFPDPPSYYRLGGAINMTLMDLIDKFMQDAGCDYIINLTLNGDVGPHKISFTVVPRFVQQPLGIIEEYLRNQTNISSVSFGQELRSDITQSFLVGGAVNFLESIYNNGTQPNIIPFFGFNPDGSVILGTTPRGTQYADDDYAFNLNGSAIADILGEVGNGIYVYPWTSEVGATYFPNISYPSTILEMRCALGGYDTWLIYLTIYQPYLANFLNINGAFAVNLDGNPVQSIVDLVNDSRGLAQSIGSIYSNNHWPAVAQRLYNFVRSVAEEYYGKKFIVLLPFNVNVKIDPFTFSTSFNDTIADAGYYPEGASALGLNYVNENFFLDQTGRFSPFLQFQYTNNFNSIGTLIPEGNPNLPSLGPKTVFADASTVDPNAGIVQWQFVPLTADTLSPQGTQIFIKCNSPENPSPVQLAGATGFGGGLIFYVLTNIGLAHPATVMSISNAVFAQAEDILGSTMDLSALMSISPVNGTATKFPILQPALQNLLNNHSAPTSLVIFPPAIYPYGAAIAIDSSQFVYGPWGQFSADGKLEFEQDDGLVPWEYGGYDVLNQAAQAKLNTIAKGNQVLERADWSEAGLPKASLGETIVEGGPVLTSISCSIGSEVITNYKMETFVNRPGAFIFENQQRLQQMGKIYQQLRRTIRQNILGNGSNQTTYNAALQGFMQGTTYTLQDKSPHAVLTGTIAPGTGVNYVPQVYTQTYQDSLRGLGVSGDGTYNGNIACVAYESIFRPFTYDSLSEGLPYFFSPDPNYDTDSLITSSGNINLNPFQEGCDITWILSGKEYNGMNTSRGNTDWGTARALALRGPLLEQGWGYDFQGAPIPNGGNLIEVGLDENDQPIYVPNAFNQLQEQSGFFYEGFGQNSIYWPTGPIDLRWNKFCGTWMSPGMVIVGMVSGYDPNHNSGPPPGKDFKGNTPNFAVYVNGELTNESMYIEAPVGGMPATGTMAIAGYEVLSNRWIFLNYECKN